MALLPVSFKLGFCCGSVELGSFSGAPEWDADYS